MIHKVALEFEFESNLKPNEIVFDINYRGDHLNENVEPEHVVSYKDYSITVDKLGRVEALDIVIDNMESTSELYAVLNDIKKTILDSQPLYTDTITFMDIVKRRTINGLTYQTINGDWYLFDGDDVMVIVDGYLLEQLNMKTK